MKSIRDRADANPVQRKFIEGDRTLRTGHIIKSGKTEENA